jgi:hypothetical protein
VAYNVQTTVDAEQKIVVDFLVTNTHNSKAMSTILELASEVLQTNIFIVLYLRGYQSAREFQ